LRIWLDLHPWSKRKEIPEVVFDSAII
jgi:hypothetical protein